jgi:dGTPase
VTIRELYQRTESEMLASYAVRSSESTGRKTAIAECDMRTCFQRDVDRITHCKAFRRLMRKTQVFLSPEGDHYRTRLTHTLEVSRIARTIARALKLNEDLVEAIALSHDLGHTPFGHAGEYALNDVVPGGFFHNEQSVRVVEQIESDGKGLNLSFEVIDGIRFHTGTQYASTSEGRLVKFADRIAYINHDIDDAIRAGILKDDDIPTHLSKILGNNYSIRIDTMVRDVISNSVEGNISMSAEIGQAMMELREFMFEAVYKNPIAKGEETKAQDMLKKLYEFFVKNPDKLTDEYLRIADKDGVERAVCDYVAGMTDSYAVNCFERLFVPKGWGFIESSRIDQFE